jgi:hypothetical protein
VRQLRDQCSFKPSSQRGQVAKRKQESSAKEDWLEAYPIDDSPGENGKQADKPQYRIRETDVAGSLFVRSDVQQNEAQLGP